MSEMDLDHEEYIGMKKTECLPTHLPLDDANAVKCLAFAAGVSVSEYIRRLIMSDLKSKEATAHATLLALGYSREQIERLVRGELKTSCN